MTNEELKAGRKVWYDILVELVLLHSVETNYPSTNYSFTILRQRFGD